MNILWLHLISFDNETKPNQIKLSPTQLSWVQSA